MSHAKHKPILGIIGGIGSGKSLVAEEFARKRGFLIVGDQLGHEALREPDVKQKVRARFGQEIVDDQGNIERRKLGARVFAHAAELRALEELVFPHIERRIGEEVARAQRQDDVDFAVLDAAVMLESGWSRICDKLIFVDAPRAVRLQRVAHKHGWNEKEVAAREQMQMDLSFKKARADFVIDNSQSAADIATQVKEILKRLGLYAASD
jgi:dephospho-CoA kinase